VNGEAAKRGIFPLPVLFFSVGGVHYGVSTDQVLSAAARGASEDGEPLWFQREMGYGGEPACPRPAAVAVKAAGGKRLTVLIDSLEEIAEVAPGEIRPLPPLVARHARRKGVWGVIPRPGRMCLLIDFALWTKS